MSKISAKLEVLKLTYQKPIEWFRKFRCFVGSIVVSIFFILGVVFGIFIYTLPDIEHTSFDKLKELTAKKVKSKLVNKKNYFRWTPLRRVNRDYLYAVVMAEDAKFFTHKGINYDALVDAMAKNYKSDTYSYGASTITQQVAKNLYLSNNKTIYRKLQEFFITKRLEKKFTKNQILEIYFNLAEFGPDIYGIRAASYRIFKKSPMKINAAEGAFLSLLLPSPRRYYYSIVQNHNITNKQKKKIKRVLSDMRFMEFISYKQYEKYLNYNYF
ncbi:MAG: transglycosylase domain-containing protein [Thiovulaceae bacterium]|nr:transglycosylase domain-containing protein [Sulfurimonadaceae bacterium]